MNAALNLRVPYAMLIACITYNFRLKWVYEYIEGCVPVLLAGITNAKPLIGMSLRKQTS